MLLTTVCRSHALSLLILYFKYQQRQRQRRSERSETGLNTPKFAALSSVLSVRYGHESHRLQQLASHYNSFAMSRLLIANLKSSVKQVHFFD